MAIKIIIILFVFLLAGYALGLLFPLPNREQPGTCTMEAKLCPDGSYVGRVPPSCEFAPCPETKTETVKVYYYNPALDHDESGNTMCSRQGLVALERKIPITNTPIKDTLNLLLKGELADAERRQGVSTEYPLAGFELKSAVLNNGILTLTFDDPENKTVGGSCRVGILWFQIEATAKQFLTVREVHFLPEEIFQP